MTKPSSSSGAMRLPYAGATIARTPAAARGPGAMLAMVLPLVAGGHAYAQSCDNQTLPGGAACASSVAAGSSADNTTVNNGATQRVSGIAFGSIVNSGGTQYIFSGGVGNGTVVNSGGSVGVSSGGTALATVVNTGGLQRVYAGGMASANSVLGGKQYVSSGGLSLDTAVAGGGTQIVYSRGTANGTLVNSGGTQYISAGGVGTDTVVNSGGSFGVSAGGLATGAIVNSGGLQRVYSAGSASANTVAGGKQYVSAGGMASGTVVNAGEQVVFARGSANDALINAGGMQIVSSGGVASSTTVNAGGTQTVLLGGSASLSTVAAGGSMELDVGGTAAGGTLASTTASGLTIAGTLAIDEAAGDALTGNAGASLSALTLNGGTVALGPAGTGGYKTLTIDGLSGSGQFVLNTNLGLQQSDQLVIDHGTGNFTLAVHDSSTSAPVNTKLLLVTTQNSSATFSLYGNAVDIGAYKFALQDAGGQYYLSNNGGKSDIATVSQAAAAIPSLLWYEQLEQTFAHLADYRDGTVKDQIWVRTYDEQLRTSPGGTASTTQFYGTQIGRDWRVAGNGSSSWYLGATGGFAQGDETIAQLGNGTVRPWNIGAYGGYTNLNGLFANAVVRYLGAKQNLNVSSPFNPANADYSQSGYSVSLEGGRRITLGGRWWLEPRVELSYQRSGSVDYQTTYGTQIGLSNSNLLLGNAGVSLGSSWMLGNTRLEPFLRVAANHIVNGTLTDTVGGTPLPTSLPQTWVAASTGVAAMLSRHVRASGQFSYGRGQDYTQPWAVTLGLSYID